MPDSKNELERYLLKQFTVDSRFGFKYDGATDILTLVTISSGFAVSIVLLFDWLPENWVVVLSSAIPGCALAIMKGLKLTQRGQWHWAKARKFESMHVRLHHGLATEEQIAKELVDFIESTPEFPAREYEKIAAQIEKSKANKK